MNAVREVEVAGKGRALVAAKDLRRGDVAFRDRAIAMGYSDVDLLANCVAKGSTDVRRCIDEELCSLSLADLSEEAKGRIFAMVDAAKAHLEFFAPFAESSDDSDDADASDASTCDDVMLRAALKLECNVFTLWTAKYEPRAICLFRLACRLNHSCSPNLVREQDGDEITFTALADIAAGDELTFTYVPASWSRAERQKLLRDYFQFECRCARCAGDPEDDARACGVLGHVGCGGSWNASGACAICGARRAPGE